ncbi:methyl-accepting chemotaxis protein [Vibrio hannami]|uniref:methyl-accepting chemotaxis protein n=1 Tax=Vibrio hannami TaxID=2717094 RepID=UPI0024108B22|nr:methyl-accepting chemotaxis protein [Vibrio hannami]MDG3085681.1 methyl-accepting chemotaxis protein [Vibrio hannami]
MKIISIISKIYFGFSVIIAVMVSASWFNLQSNKNVSSSIYQVNNKSTPLLINFSEIQGELLNINRNLTPYLFALYIDELELIEEKINLAVNSFMDEFNRTQELTVGDAVLSSNIEKFDSLLTEVLATLKKILQAQYLYLDAKELSTFSNEDMSIFFKKTHNDISRLANNKGSVVTLERFDNAVSVLELKANNILSLVDFGEIRREIKNLDINREELKLLSSDFESKEPELYKQLEESFTGLEHFVFSEQGSLAIHLKKYQHYESVQTLYYKLQLSLDDSLSLIRALSDEAGHSSEVLIQASSEALNYSFYSIVVGVCLSMLVAFSVGYGITRSIKEPARKINMALERIANKELMVRVDYKGKNEFGNIANKVNQTVEQIAEVIHQISDASGELNTVCNENHQHSDSLSSSFEQQSSQMMTISSAMEEIEYSVNEISNAACQSQSLVTEAVNYSDNSQEQLRENHLLMHSLSEKLSQSTHTISLLETESAQIESILEVISGISEQTNLLALNAAIEAARAGEQGRGFAVVADEVRVLASKTTKSASEIRDKIEHLQNRARNAAKEVNECHSYMNQYTSHVDSVNRSLAGLHEALKEIESGSYQIVTSTSEHQMAAKEVTTTINLLHELTERNAKNANQLAMLGQNLELMAEQQQTLASTFRT